jgi:hypothetical protein
VKGFFGDFVDFSPPRGSAEKATAGHAADRRNDDASEGEKAAA